MTNHVLLRNVDHADLKIIPGRGARFDDNVMSTVTFPAEFRDVQMHYPIFFRPTGVEGGYEPCALFGFEFGENLFLTQDGWDAHYVPMAIEREPFAIGRDGEELSVHVDLDSPKLSTTEGEPLFLPYGGSSEYLEHATSMLRALHEGMQFNVGFVGALVELGLIEGITVDIELEDGSENRLGGFVGINEEKLAGLTGEDFAKLNASGYLTPIYMIVASMANFRDLIARKNAQLHARALPAHG